MRISDWSSDVCSSDLGFLNRQLEWMQCTVADVKTVLAELRTGQIFTGTHHEDFPPRDEQARRSAEHTSELQSLMRISYAVFCLKKNNRNRSIVHASTAAEGRTPATHRPRHQ